MKPTCLSVTIAALLLPLAAAQADPIPKQLAGPPSEFASMQVPDPAAAAVHSKSALLPITFPSSKAGNALWRGELPVENGSVRFALFTGQDTASWDLQLIDPSGRPMPTPNQEKAATPTRLGTEAGGIPGTLYSFDNVSNGSWTVQLATKAGAPRSGFLLIEGDQSTELASYQTHRRQLLGERIGFAAMLTSFDPAVTDDDRIKLGRGAGRIQHATLRVTSPDGHIGTYPMFDDGMHDDGIAGDGIYGGEFMAKQQGSYIAQVEVRGRNSRAQPVVRTAEHVVPIIAPTLALAASPKAVGSADDAGRYSIRLPVTSDKKDGHYRVHAEVWGSDPQGNDIPVAWIGGMTDLAAGQLKFGLDERWVVKAGARAPFELRNVRIEDPDHFITMAGAEQLPVTLPAPRTKLAADAVEIDEAMTMGQRPAGLDQAKGTGSRLLLVHGYCSGGVWPTSHFTNASTFLDANQNRSHDQFARLIRDYGSNWHSFGTVAHSQGGAASLHLYTYYWSGLDNAGSGRLIQSVGTPYQGTNLSGVLAAMGSWFGVGCGTNDNMTYSGASAWLAGIPSWARSKVNYYTTSFRSTNWWTNDYCNFGSDLVLSDPEDGTTEKAYGQLSGAYNRGHVSGQCHTDNMRDPAQYRDSNRNSVMNANAAR